MPTKTCPCWGAWGSCIPGLCTGVGRALLWVCGSLYVYHTDMPRSVCLCWWTPGLFAGWAVPTAARLLWSQLYQTVVHLDWPVPRANGLLWTQPYHMGVHLGGVSHG